jgi:DNA polymerase-1
MKKVVVIDGNNLYARGFGICKYSRANALKFVVGMILTVKNTNKDARIVFAFDTMKSKRRLELFPNYKGNRKSSLTPEEKQEFNRCFNELVLLMKTTGCTVMDGYGYEADDFIACFTRMLRPIYAVTVISTDNDLYQLINDNVSQFDPFKSILITKDNFENVVGIPHESFVDYKCIVGDPSDSIPGYDGVGEKTARKYLSFHRNYEGIFKAVSVMTGKKKEVEKRMSDRSIYERNKQLIDLEFYYNDIDLKKHIKRMVEESKLNEPTMYKIMLQNDIGELFEDVKGLCRT